MKTVVGVAEYKNIFFLHNVLFSVDVMWSQT